MSTFTPGRLNHSVVIGISDPKKYDNGKSNRSNSIYRTWRQLTTQQKSVLVVLTITIIMFLYVFLHKTSIPINELEADTEHREHLLPLKNPLKDKEMRQRFMDERHAELDKKIRPLKRGPPRQKTSTDSIETEDDSNFNSYIIVNGVKEYDLKQLEERKRLINSVEAQGDFSHYPEKISMTERQIEVVKACRHAWDGYRKFAWGHDELKPMSQSHREWFMLGLTIVDSLDTLWLMNMMDEYKEARNWVASELSFNKAVSVNLFETTIRVLGGLLSIYHLTADQMYLDKAADLGDRLMGGFTSGSKIPYSDVNLLSRSGRPPAWGSDSSLAEVATLQLEFNDLSYALNNPRYKSAGYNVMLQIFSLSRPSGLCPIYLNADSGQFRSGATITLGARGDSYYEYLLKQWIQTGKTDEQMKDEYIKSIDGVRRLLIKKTPGNLTYVGELLNGRNFSPKMDHLVCFLPGLLALGYHHGLPEDHLQLAKELTETCYQMYARMATGLSPEIAHFYMDGGKAGEDLYVKRADAHNLLRPETVETLHIMYAVTKDNRYREYGWKIFQAFEKYTKVPTGGYVSLNNVQDARNPERGGRRDKMESFFIAETLKYLYLLFSDDDILPVDKYVFNTEAHPLPVIAMH